MVSLRFVVPLFRSLHILSICAWIGGGLGIALLLILDRQAESVGDLQSFNRVIDAIDDYIVAPGAISTLVTGLSLAKARRFRVMKTPWLSMKLYVTLAAIGFGLFFVSRWLEKLLTYALRDDFAVFDDRLYFQAYIVGVVGCTVQAVVVLGLVAYSALRPCLPKSLSCGDVFRGMLRGAKLTR